MELGKGSAGNQLLIAKSSGIPPIVNLLNLGNVRARDRRWSFASLAALESNRTAIAEAKGW